MRKMAVMRLLMVMKMPVRVFDQEAFLCISGASPSAWHRQL